MKDKEGHKRLCFYVTDNELALIRRAIPHGYRQEVFHTFARKLIEEYAMGNKAVAVDIVRGDMKLQMLAGEKPRDDT